MGQSERAAAGVYVTVRISRAAQNVNHASTTLHGRRHVPAHSRRSARARVIRVHRLLPSARARCRTRCHDLGDVRHAPRSRSQTRHGRVRAPCRAQAIRARRRRTSRYTRVASARSAVEGAPAWVPPQSTGFCRSRSFRAHLEKAALARTNGGARGRRYPHRPDRPVAGQHGARNGCPGTVTGNSSL